MTRMQVRAVHAGIEIRKNLKRINVQAIIYELIIINMQIII